MSEILAEARVIIRPDTTGFRALLQSEVLAAAKGVTAPVTVTPIAATVGASQAALAAQTTAATTAINAETIALQRQGAAAVQASVATRSFTTTQSQLQKGVIASAAGVTGLRGAVLAASSPFLIAAVSVTAFAKALQSAVELDTRLRTFEVTIGATAEQMAEVREQAKLLGRDISLPGVSAGDAAEALLTLARAGLTVEDSLEGARGVLQLATAAEISNADASLLAASALNAFGLAGSSAVDVADLLTNAANASQASINEMGIALRQSAAIANIAGFSLGETVTFLTALAKAGLTGSDAGTSFRVAIQRLIAPTDAARKVLDRLNISLLDAQGNLRPEAFFELSDALDQMGRAQENAARQTIFGADASRAAAIFARLNVQAFRDQEQALERQGSAAEVAGAKTEGLAGKTENLKNQLDALGVELGELAIPPVSIAVDILAEGFGLLATQISDSRKAIGGFADDAEQLQRAIEDVSRESGFTDFLSDVASGAELVAGDISRASDATDDFVRRLAGAEGSGEAAARSIRILTEEEKRLASALRDSHDRVNIQERDFRNLATAAQEAAGAVARLTGQIAGIQEQVTRARVSGDTGAEFDLLQQERERLQRLLAIQEDIVAQGGAGAATARRRIREQILPQLESVNNEIRAITEEQVRETERLADDAERARNERDANILRALGREEDRRTNAVIVARSTEALQDDLKAQIALRNFFQRTIREIKQTVQDGKTAAPAIATATRDLIQAQQDIQRTRQELAQQQRDARREERERLRESLSLDVQIAQATGNRAREIQAREREIDFIQEQIRQTRRGSNQRKRLILELRQAQAELKELKVERDKTNKTAEQFFFEQLQAQQGFAANLLGNIIPRDQTAGLVGVPPPPGQPPRLGGIIRAEAAEGRGRAQAGPTAGQASTTNDILLRILDQLKSLNSGEAAPEAKNQRKMGASTFAGGGGMVPPGI